MKKKPNYIGRRELTLFHHLSPLSLSRFINLHFLVLSDTVHTLSTHCRQQSVKRQKHKHHPQTMDQHTREVITTVSLTL